MMNYLIDPKKLYQALHQSLGVCGHCGKQDCAGKASHSILPSHISLDDLNKAMDASKVNVRELSNDA